MSPTLLKTRCLFTFTPDKNGFTDWFKQQILSRETLAKVSVKNLKHQNRMLVQLQEMELEYDFAGLPGTGHKYVRQAQPRLGFFAALRGKPDVAKAYAVRLAHDILSTSSRINELAWYREKQMWKDASAKP